LTRLFESKRDEIIGGWRELYITELHNFYSSPKSIKTIKSTRIRWLWHVARVRRKKKTKKILFGKPEGKRPLERPRHRRENNIKMDFRSIGCCSMNSIHLAEAWWFLKDSDLSN
jgi:hypothetical protein